MAMISSFIHQATIATAQPLIATNIMLMVALLSRARFGQVVSMRPCRSALPDSHTIRRGTFANWLVVAFLLLSTGCENSTVMKQIMPSRTFHQKFNLRAEDYFNDPSVLQLCDAIERNDLTRMREIIDAGANVSCVGKGGVTPLFWAFPDNKLERFVLLLEKGAKPNVRLTSNLNLPNVFRAGDTVVHLSARSQFEQHFLEVMKHGGDATLSGRNADGVIHEIIKSNVPNPVPRIRAAINAGADINAYDRAGYTPIHLSVIAFSQFDVAERLLELGADPTIMVRDDLGDCVHSLLALKRSVANGSGMLAKQDYSQIDSFLKAVKEHGYDVDEAQADIERWAELANKNPARPGWFREAEIKRLNERAAARVKAKKPVEDAPTN